MTETACLGLETKLCLWERINVPKNISPWIQHIVREKNKEEKYEIKK